MDEEGWLTQCRGASMSFPATIPAAFCPTATANATDHRHRLLHILSQCTTMSQLKQLHAYALRTTPDPQHPDTVFLYTRLFNLASSIGDLNYTFRLFNKIPHPGSIWNTLIHASARSHHRKHKAFLIFRQMLATANVPPDKHTFPFVLKACSYLFAFFEGQQAHAQALKHGLGSDVYVGNSLIHFYSSCGYLEDARRVFDKMTERSLVSWNVMIDALVEFGNFEEALGMFRKVQIEFEPDGFTMQSVLGACSGLGSLYLGMWAHGYIVRNYKGDVNTDVLLNNCLVNMYCKCGSLRLAVQVFDRMSKHDLHSWNSMILGFAMYGEVDEALECFDKMVSGGIMPNSITFVGVLSACNHRGLVSQGRKYFDRMVDEFKITPVLEHYGCLVDLLARKGCIDEALDVVSNMPMQPDAVIWRSLLDGCCKKNLDIRLSEEVAKKVMESNDSVSSGVYVLLSRVYAAAKKWNEVGLIRQLMTDKGVSKEPGCSQIEIDGVSHEFFAGDTSHPVRNEIYEFLDVIEEKLKSVGYAPDFSQAPLVDEFDGGNDNSLRLHSERLAVAYGLLNSKPGMPIRVFKNLRICNDCHNVMKLISRIFDVEIIIRDRIRFHHFRDGSCSCMDYW
nr:pentatricopeptide repeat-containing protein At1g59720, chloroplastic/mitochondrial [Ipomoea batatas]GMD95658.1 pentatricopeptide repeat-containing protein At1g59720, chloroplastic/mitochondrial [Ipomoea batatas]GME01225.1 pentatricopeptide repeat-containing protein At1g59720, chloroplastic/mitochondrial [Ipomoea batatas]GME17609.1 pentatricopeptide repeat-containing protein At1g59720, chloroplastic/mitochondrial [Ipomoea batatas]